MPRQLVLLGLVAALFVTIHARVEEHIDKDGEVFFDANTEFEDEDELFFDAEPSLPDDDEFGLREGVTVCSSAKPEGCLDCCLEGGFNEPKWIRSAGCMCQLNY